MGKVLKVREVGDPALGKISEEVDIENINSEIIGLIEELKTTLQFGTGLGIAAPQIGVNKKIIVVGASKDNITYNDAEDVPSLHFLSQALEQSPLPDKKMHQQPQRRQPQRRQLQRRQPQQWHLLKCSEVPLCKEYLIFFSSIKISVGQ